MMFNNQQEEYYENPTILSQRKMNHDKTDKKENWIINSNDEYYDSKKGKQIVTKPRETIYINRTKSNKLTCRKRVTMTHNAHQPVSRRIIAKKRLTHTTYKYNRQKMSDFDIDSRDIDDDSRDNN